MLKVGDRIPPFTLMASNGAEISDESLAGQRYVLYSYPKDDTPGCTKEACAFRDHLPKLGELGVAVYGLSADDEKSHIRFGRKYALNFPLLADPERRLIEPLGVWVEKRMYGKAYMGVARSTFVVGPDGLIEQVWDKVNPEGHAEEVLAWLRARGLAAPAAAARPAPKAAAAPAKAAAAARSGTAPKAAARASVASRTAKPKAKAKPAKTAPRRAAAAKTGARGKAAPKAKPTAAARPGAKARPAAKAKPGAKGKPRPVARARPAAKGKAKARPARAAKGRRRA